MALLTGEVDICNQSLYKIGANTFVLATQTGVQALRCIAHYYQTRDALLRSHWWRFASARATLKEDTESPDFEFDNQFSLPKDFLRLKSVFSDNATATENTRYSYAIEGDKILTDDSTVEIRYIKKVTDTTKFDPLFTEVLILSLAVKLVAPVAGGASKLQEALKNELAILMRKVRTLDRQETNTIGRLNRRPWNEARMHGGGTWRQDRV